MGSVTRFYSRDERDINAQTLKYHSLQLSVQRRLNRGLQMGMAYTLAKGEGWTGWSQDILDADPSGGLNRLLNYGPTGTDRRLTVHHSQRLPHSLGLLYEDLTEHLGFLRSSDEYKVMAMASYGEPRFLPQLRRQVRATDDGGFVTERIDWQSLAKRLEPGEEWTSDHADLAASVQKRLEEVLLDLARGLRARTGGRRLTLGVQLAPSSRGGSRHMHGLSVGDLVEMTGPVQSFPLGVGAVLREFGRRCVDDIRLVAAGRDGGPGRGPRPATFDAGAPNDSCVVACVTSSPSRSLARPKSSTLTRSSRVSMTLALLKSRWTTPRSCACPMTC